jgi:excisionase family DNA binding protein
MYEKPMHIDEFAKEVKIDPNTVRAAVRRGEVFATRIGRRYLIPASEVNRLLNPQREQTEVRDAVA